MKLKSIITVCILLTTSYGAMSAWKTEDVDTLIKMHQSPEAPMGETLCTDEEGIINGLYINHEKNINNLDLSDIIFQSCSFECTHFTKLILTGCKFFNCKCREAHFSGCDLDEAKFDGRTKIDGANFDDASLIDATIEALCIDCHFQWANLKGARVVYVSESDFEHATLVDADFGGALLLEEMDWFMQRGAICNKPR